MRLPIPAMDIAKILVACLAMVGAVELIPAFGGMLELVLKAGTGMLAYALCVTSLDAAGARSFASNVISKLKSRLKPGAATS